MATRSQAEAGYWQRQIKAAERDNRFRRWCDVGQQFYDRYRLESAGLYMNTGNLSPQAQSRSIFNLLWSNTQTMLPMLYSRLPEVSISRRFYNADPVARMAATIGERATTVDLERDDLDEQAEACALDYLLVGRGVIRGIYEHTVLNTRIPVRQEDTDDGAPRFVTEAGEQIPKEVIQNDSRGFFALDPQTTDERAPLLYHFWKDFLTGPGRKWSDISKDGWISYRLYMTKPEARRRFGNRIAETLNYAINPYNISSDNRAMNSNSDEQGKGGIEKVAAIYEVWDAKSKQIRWVSKDNTELLDKQDDYLQLEGFFNTPRPMKTTFTNDTLIPVPDYAEYYSQAKELDQITAKIEQIVEEIRAGGMYDGTIDKLGSALKNKTGGWYPSENWAKFLQAGGMKGGTQGFNNVENIQTVTALYQHRDQTKRDADEISGMIDLFRGQQSQRDETLGQSQIRQSMGGLRINDRQREFQRYMRDCLRIKGEIIVTKFDAERILEMAGGQALINESADVTGLRLFAESDQGKQALQNPQVAQMFAMRLAEATQKQQGLIASGLQLLQSDQMRNMKIDLETDATVAIDEFTDKQQATEFVEGVGNYLGNVLGSDALNQNPELKPLAAEMLLFMVRRFKAGRSLEQKVEAAVESMVTRPAQPPQPDPLMADVERQAKKDQADVVQKEKQLRLDAYEAETDRMEAQAKAVNAAKDSDRKDLETANKILDSDNVSEIAGNA